MVTSRRGSFIIVALLIAGCASALAQQEILRFEAEEISSPEDAWLVNTHSDEHWNLWSTDVDAERKWSGGVVLRSPEVMEDRERPEDGAPPLHATVTGIPEGTWRVTIGGLGRPLASLLMARRGGGRPPASLESSRSPTAASSCGSMTASPPRRTPAPRISTTSSSRPRWPSVTGVTNGDFEFLAEDGHTGWTWWTREEGAGTAKRSPTSRTRGPECACTSSTPASATSPSATRPPARDERVRS
jgi:hypothetical protein